MARGQGERDEGGIGDADAAAGVRRGRAARFGEEAAVELEVSEAAVSLHIGQLRKELGDRLFVRTAAGLAFTPGGLRLASRAAEMLGLQDRTMLEVSQAGRGRRLLRIAASSLFAEHAAPGLIELFAGRADDLDVELSVQPPGRFDTLLRTRAVDVAIGPEPGGARPTIGAQAVPELPARPGRRARTTRWPAPGRAPAQLREQTWLLGPSAVQPWTARCPQILRRLGVPEDAPADLPEPRRGAGGGQARHAASRWRCRSPWPTTCARAGWCGSPVRAPPRRPAGGTTLPLAEHGRAAGGRRAEPVRHHAARDPGDAARVRASTSGTSGRRST